MHIFCLFAVEKETDHTPIPVSWQSGVKRRRRIRASTTYVCCLQARAKSAGCTPHGTTCRSIGMMTWWRTGAPTTSARTPSYHAILSSIPTGDKTLNPVYIAVYLNCSISSMKFYSTDCDIFTAKLFNTKTKGFFL